MRLFAAFRAFFNVLRGIEEKPSEGGDSPHLALLSLLQQSGRLVDFLKEEISQYSDEQVGAAVRQLHEGCAGRLEELVAIRPLAEEQEGAKITIPKGYDPSHYQLVGKVKGDPPYEGVVRHRGWKAHRLSLPSQVGGWQRDVVAPVEVEIE